jgi:tetratricopeptide (TPR) repeat protein
MASASRHRAALWADPIGLHLDAAAKAPGNPRVRLNLGVIYLNAGRASEAERELVEAKRLYDRGESVNGSRRIGAFIHYNLGALLYVRGEFAEATAHLERSLVLGGQYLALRPMALYLLGRIAFAQQRWETAAKRFTEALRYNNRNPDWFVELASAQLRWQPDRPDLARRTLEQGLTYHPNHPQLLSATGSLPAPQALD